MPSTQNGPRHDSDRHDVRRSVAVILYHYTNKQNRLLISWQGLKAHVKDNERYMTLGKPVVWLTKESSAPLMTQWDIDHFNNHLTREDIKDSWLDKFEVGAALWPDRTERVTVDISRASSRLVFYADFLRKHHIEWELSASALTNWYVYFGNIAPQKLCPITVGEARVGLQIQIGLPTHDAEQKASYQRLLDSMAGADDGRFCDWNLIDNEDAPE
jgi:hypothetical protein